MILVGIGSNVDGPWGTPFETVEKAIKMLNETPLMLIKVSKIIKTAPFGNTDQPDFQNAVAIVETDLEPAALMQHLHEIELSADRRRTVRWGPRTLDLDLLDYRGRVISGELASDHGPLFLPHKGIAARTFVLEPIAEIAPNWRHPETGLSAVQMLDALQTKKV